MTDYYPFGEIRSDQTTTAHKNNYKFTGKELDSDTGLYYYGARYYNPAIGRFVSQDPWEGDLKDPQSLNKYSYVRNNPLKYVDPTGKTFMERLGGFFGGLWDAGTSTLNAVAHPIDTIISTVNQFTENTKYLYNYGKNHSATQFFSDFKEGVGIKIDEFNQMSEYEKGHAIGSVTEKVAEAAIVGKAIGKMKGEGTVADGTFNIPKKIVGQMEKRGWTNELMNSTRNKSFATREALNKATGNKATAYFNKNGSHMVIDNITNQVIQISDRTKMWYPDPTIIDPYNP